VIFEPEKFLSVPACVFVGDGDVLRDNDLNQDPEVDAQQGMNRFERGTAPAGGHAGGGRRARALDSHTCSSLWPGAAIRLATA
jgi:hypothetical protein